MNIPLKGIKYPSWSDRCWNCRQTYGAHLNPRNKAHHDCFKKHVYDFRSAKERAERGER